MHTSVTELRTDSGGQIRVAVRLYADDLALAVGSPAALPSDSAVSRYVRSRLTITDRRGASVPLRWEGREPSGNAVVIRLAAALPVELGGARIENLLLTDRFPDQVNVVRATHAGRTATLLFTAGDGAKELR
jgi:hypothetical protein